ncbi:Imm6 family immunity protein [Bacillus safensis]|uniref:Imm6 family immunity protein n=1 Tax=Bacillus safensis TaxID=561879 RepID=UPI002FFF6CE0
MLYELLDNEENGITIIQEMSDIETDILAWNCIIDAVAYTSRKAFERRCQILSRTNCFSR